MLNNSFLLPFENCAVNEKMREKKYCRVGQAIDDKMDCSRCMLDT